MAGAEIQVTGFRDLKRALKNTAPETRKQLGAELKAVAETVAADARQRVPSRSGRAAASIRATGGVSGAYIVGGKKSVPYYSWLDFGSRTPVSGNPRKRGPWFRSGRGPTKGRFIYPAIDARRERIRDAVAHAVEKAAHKAGFKK